MTKERQSHPHYRVTVSMIVRIPEHEQSRDHQEWIRKAVEDLYPYDGGEPWIADAYVTSINNVPKTKINAIYSGTPR